LQVGDAVAIDGSDASRLRDPRPSVAAGDGPVVAGTSSAIDLVAPRPARLLRVDIPSDAPRLGAG